METNVGDMPLDIFADYVSDILGEEWSWEYLALVINGQNSVPQYTLNSGCGSILYGFLDIKLKDMKAKGVGFALYHPRYKFHCQGGGHYKNRGNGPFFIEQSNIGNGHNHSDHGH